MVQIVLKKPDINQRLTGNKLPILFYSGHINNQPEWRFPTHKHDNLTEIIFVTDGEGTFIIDNKTYIAGKGDILIYNKGVVHEEFSNPTNPLETYFCGVGNLNLNESGVEEGNILPSNIAPVLNSGIYSNEINTYISSIFKETQKQEYGFETVCQNLLLSMIVLIVRLVRSIHETYESQDKHALSSQIKDYIEQNYKKNISLKDIADRFYISSDYVSHIFKKHVNYSPIQYLMNCRIGEAKRLLLTTNLKVHEVSQYVGYDNSNYFAMVFKSATNETPTSFRKNNARINPTPHGKLTYRAPR
jgi:AraC-like DNA-binding protein